MYDRTAHGIWRQRRRHQDSKIHTILKPDAVLCGRSGVKSTLPRDSKDKRDKVWLSTASYMHNHSCRVRASPHHLPVIHTYWPCMYPVTASISYAVVLGLATVGDCSPRHASLSHVAARRQFRADGVYGCWRSRIVEWNYEEMM